MRFHMRCAYCPHVVQIDVAQQVRVTRRSDEIARVKCPSCGSTFSVELSTKRRTKGAGAKAAEAKLAAEHRAEVAAACELNARIGDQLLAMPGCTCSRYLAQRELGGLHRVTDYGHLLSHGMSRSKSGAMVPVLPRHLHVCPCRGTEAEAKLVRQMEIAVGFSLERS